MFPSKQNEIVMHSLADVDLLLPMYAKYQISPEVSGSMLQMCSPVFEVLKINQTFFLLSYHSRKNASSLSPLLEADCDETYYYSLSCLELLIILLNLYFKRNNFNLL